MSSMIGNVATRSRSGRKAAEKVAGELQEFLALPVAYGFRAMNMEMAIHPKARPDHTYERILLEFARMDAEDYKKGIILKVTAYSEAWDGTNKGGELVGPPREASAKSFKIEPDRVLILGRSSRDPNKSSWRLLNLGQDVFGDQQPWGKVFEQLMRSIKSGVMNVQRALFARGGREELWNKISERRSGRGSRSGGGNRGGGKQEAVPTKPAAKTPPAKPKSGANGAAKKPTSAAKPADPALAAGVKSCRSSTTASSRRPADHTARPLIAYVAHP